MRHYHFWYGAAMSNYTKCQLKMCNPDSLCVEQNSMSYCIWNYYYDNITYQVNGSVCLSEYSEFLTTVYFFTQVSPEWLAVFIEIPLICMISLILLWMVLSIWNRGRKARLNDTRAMYRPANAGGRNTLSV